MGTPQELELKSLCPRTSEKWKGITPKFLQLPVLLYDIAQLSILREYSNYGCQYTLNSQVTVCGEMSCLAGSAHSEYFSSGLLYIIAQSAGQHI